MFALGPRKTTESFDLIGLKDLLDEFAQQSGSLEAARTSRD
jgi:hypothetical protein